MKPVQGFSSGKCECSFRAGFDMTNPRLQTGFWPMKRAIALATAMFLMAQPTFAAEPRRGAGKKAKATEAAKEAKKAEPPRPKAAFRVLPKLEDAEKEARADQKR